MRKVRVKVFKKMKKRSRFSGKVREIIRKVESENLKFLNFSEKVRERGFNIEKKCFWVKCEV